MSTTPNLLISYIQASQNQKEVTANAAFLALEEALTDATSIAMTDTDYTFATGAGSVGLSNLVFAFTGALTATRNVIFPPNAKLYVVLNSTSGAGSPLTPTQSLTFKVGTGAATVTLDDTRYHILYCDGVNSVYAISGKNAETIASGIVDLPTALIASGAQSTLISIAATPVLTTDVVEVTFSGDPTGVTGFHPAAGGVLNIVKFCLNGSVNF